MQQLQQPRPVSSPHLPQTQKFGNTSSGNGGNRPGARFITQTWKTLKGQFLFLAGCTLLFSVIAALLLASIFWQVATDMDTIVKSSAPSVDAAQAMGAYIQDIDAKAADSLATAGLTEHVPCSLPETRSPSVLHTLHECDTLAIDAEILLFNKELYLATHNVTYPGERTAIERITAGFEEYVSDLGTMRIEYDAATNKTDTHEIHLQKAHQAYQAANNALLLRITRQPLTNAQGQPIYNEIHLPDCQIKDPLGDHLVLATTWPLGGIQENIDCLSSMRAFHNSKSLSQR
jgi:hypothetical protein